jgi:peptidoglycan/xylan/chitin deacetylase (PgdA/CDA1 family)
MYHRFSHEKSKRAVDAAEFDFQVRQIARHFRPKTLRQLAAELRSPGGVEPRSVVITVDDGYEDFHRVAFPILRKHGVPATIFVTTDFVDGRLWLWPDVLHFAFEQSTKREVELDLSGRPWQLRLTSDADRQAAWSTLVDRSLSLPDDQMRALHQHVLERCEVVLPQQPVPEYQPLSWEQVRELDAAGIEIGAHTKTHPALTRIPLQQVHNEIAGSKRRIEEMLGHAIDTFCYPNGTSADVNEEVKRAVRAAGFTAATVAYFDRWVTHDMYELRRYPVGAWRRKFLQALQGVDLLTAGLRSAAATAQ